MAYDITTQDVKDRYEGDLTTRFSEQYLQTKLDDAIALIDGECPTVAERYASGALSANNFKRVVADVVLRVVRNPGGYASEGEAGVSYTLRASVASGDLYLTKKDVALLTGRRDIKSLAGTVSIGVDAGWAR